MLLVPVGPRRCLFGLGEPVSHHPVEQLADLRAGRVPTREAAAQRAGLYARAAWGVAEGVHREGARAGGFALERRVMGLANHCEDCPPLAARGWVPIGSLPGIGETACRWNCYCHFEYLGGPR